MAAVTGMAFSLSDALADAAKLDNKFNKWVDQAIEIETHMKKAFLAPSSDGIAKDLLANLATLKAAIDGMKGETISPKVNTEELDELTKAIDVVNSRINDLVDIAAKDGISLELFNVNSLNASGEGVLSLQSKLESLLDKMQEVEVQWKDNLEAFEEAKGKGDTQQMAAATLNILDLEKEYNLLNEKKKKVEADLAWAKKSVSEQNEVIAKKQKKVQAEENAEVQRITKSYIRLNQELRDLVNSRDAIEKASSGKAMTAMEQDVYNSVVAREAQVRDEILKLETEHLEEVSELRIRYAAKDAKNIVEEIKKRQYSSSEALALASSARTGTQMEYAKEAVKNALMTVDKDDTATIAALNKAYIDLRANIEKLTKAQKNEQTLQPTLRNEYARVLAEIDKVAEAKEKLEATDAYKAKDKQAVDDYKALEAREADLLKRKVEIRDGNEALLTEIETKHEAERAQKRTEALLRYEKELEAFRAKYGEITSFEAQDVIDSSDEAKNVRQSQKAIEDLKDARAKLSSEDANYEETLEKLNAEIKKHEERIESVTKAEEYREKQAKKARETYDGAMNYSKQAKSLNEMKEAMRSLEVARNKEEVGTKKYKELDRELSRITKRYKELTGSAAKASRSLWNVGDQLTRKLALVFSVSQIQGYIHKLMEVRGEFELQKRSLDAILQNKDLADDVWQKTIDLAIKSPFRVKELVGYTKQLAAYRIEGDKLYETNKMLADVSAGLGVEMNRLILAYGQVRSAEYLRGTELRQFTEAGIPMLDELSKLLSETEGRAISAGEVFEMISKRMVGFAEVEEVFRRMTSAGGVFYQMQEKQADTLKGQISNLRDSVDLMLNAIGGEMEGVLKGSVEAVRKLVENWKDLVDVLNTFPVKAILAIFAQTKVASSGIGQAFYNFAGKIPLVSDGLLWLEISVENLTKKSKLLGKAWGGLLKIIGGTATIGATIGLVWLVKKLGEMYLRTTELERATKRLNKAWEDIFSEDTSELKKGIDSYTDLVTRLREANEGSQERRDIIRRLNSEYGQYLDFVVSETTSVEQLADSYDLVVKRMKEKASLATYEKGVQAIEDEYTASLKYAKEEFYDIFKGMSIKREDSSFGGIIPTTEDVDNIYALVQQKIQELSAEQMDSLAEQQDIIQSIVKGYYGDEFFLSRDYANAIELMNVLAQKKEKEEELQKEINARYKETLKSRKAHLAYQKLESEYAEEQRKINKEGSSIEDEALRAFEVGKKLEALRQQFELNKIQLQFDFGLISEEEMTKQKDKIINWATATTKSVNEAINAELGDDFSEMELSKVLINQERQSKGIAAILKDIQDSWEQQNATIAEQISLKSEGRVIDEDLLAKAIRMEELYRRVAAILGIELKYTERLSEESRNAINALLPEDYQISLEEAYGGIDTILTNLKAKETEHLNVIEQLNEQKKNGLPIDEDALRMAEESYWWTKKTQDLLDPKAKTAISQERVGEINAKLEEKYQIDSIDRTKDEVTLLSEANSEKQKAIAYEAQLLAMQTQGVTVTNEQLALAKKDVEQWTLRWKLLGGTEKEKATSSRQNSLYDERIKVIDDMNKKYRELAKTLPEVEAKQGAFNAYIDAFAEAYKDIKWVPSNVKEMTPEQFAEQVLNFPNEDDLVAFLDKLAEEPMKAFEKIKVELAKGEYVLDAKVRVQKDAAKELLDDIQNMFDEYDLALEIKKLNIPSELAKSLFDVDYLDLDGLKKAVQEQEAKFIGTDMEDEYKKFLKKISDLSRKQREDEAKEFVNFLKKNLNEIQLIQDKGAYNISLADKLFGQGKITAEQYISSIRQIVEDTNKEVAKVNLDKFKDSATYIKAMGNLAAYSRDELEGMISALQGQVGANAGNMGADEIRAYYEALERLVEQYDKIESPFQKGEINDLIEYLNLQKQLNQEKEKEAALEQRKAEINNRLNLLQAQLKSQQERGDVLGAASTQRQIKSAVGELKEVDGELVSVTSNISVISEKVANLGDGMIKSLVVAQKVVNEIANIANAATKMFDDIKSAADALGADTESGGWAKAGYAMEMVGGVSSELTSGLSNLASGNFAGALANVVGVVTKLISGFAKIHDQNYQDIIEAQAEQVERLGKAYEKLETATASAYSIQQLQQYNEELERNVELQIASYKAMIAAEHAKKNTDEEQIAAWNEELDALTEQWKELKDSLLEGVGGVSKDNYRSQTREFVDAWVSAFKETGNGLQGLKDNFREFFDNIIAEQAAMRVTEKFLEPFYESLNEALKDYELTVQESKDLREMVEKIAPDLSSALEKIWSQLGGSRGEAEGGSLSALQKGIQGITEDTAQIIEAYLNSIRGYVSEQVTHTRNIYNILKQATTSDAAAIRVRMVE